MIKLSTYNVNGWTERNAAIRQSILEHVASDIISINETHCENNSDNQPSLSGYTWFGHCRASQHVNANMRHGGVGVFIKNSFLTNYDVKFTDRSFDGIICFLFQHKISKFTLLLISCYLPPENSPWGRDSNEFYSHILIYLHNYADFLL